MEAASAHAVIAGTEGSAAIDGDLWHRRRRHRLDHLGAVLDHAGFFIFTSDHVAGGVVHIEQRRARLAAGLDEVGGLVGAGHVERAVVGDDADRLPLDAGMAADGGRAIAGREFGEVGIVDEPRDGLTHVDRALVIHRHDAEQFLRVVTWRPEVVLDRPGPVPFQLRHDLARNTQRIAIVLGEVVAETGNRGVHLGAAEFLFSRNLAGCRLQQRRAGEKGAGAAAHHHDVVGQARLVGAAGRGRAVGDGNDRQARG